MAPTTKGQIPKASIDRSKLPRPAFGPTAMKKKSAAASRATEIQQPIISSQKARMSVQAVPRDGLKTIKAGDRPGGQTRPSLIPPAQPRRSILANRNPNGPANENVYAHNRSKALEGPQNGGVIPPPRKSILAPVGSNARLHRPSFGGGHRVSQIGLKPPAGNRLSIMQQQIAAGPIQFEVDETATRSILTNQGIPDDAAARAGSLVAASRPSMYASRRRKSMASVGTFGMEEATRALARQVQANMILQPDRKPNAQAPPSEADGKARTPARLSMYRRQSTSRFFGTSTPISARKVERPRNVDGTAKMDYLKVPGTPESVQPLPSFEITAERNGDPSLDEVRPVPLVFAKQGNGPSICIIPETPPKAPVMPVAVETTTSKAKVIRGILGMIPNSHQLMAPANGQSPARAPRIQMKGTIGKSPMRAATFSRYSRRTTIEFEQIYANFSPSRLEMELEAVCKQKKAIEKLLATSVTKSARMSKTALAEQRASHMASIGLATIVESRERESSSPPLVSAGLHKAMPMLEEEDESLPSTSGISKHASPGQEEDDRPSPSGVSTAFSKMDEDSESDEEEVVPAKIRARRNAKSEEESDKPCVNGFGMRLRPRNK